MNLCIPSHYKKLILACIAVTTDSQLTPSVHIKHGYYRVKINVMSSVILILNSTAQM